MNAPVTTTRAALPAITPLYSLSQAAAELDPAGRMITVSTLRTEIRKGRLNARLIAGKLCLTRGDIDEWLEETRCPVKTAAPDSSQSARNPCAAQSGTSDGTREARSASVRQAWSVVSMLKSILSNSSKAKHRARPAPVIPMR